MRFFAAALLWLLTTAALVVALPATWTQHNLVDRAGYTALAASAAEDPALRAAMAGELTTQITDRFSVDADVVAPVAGLYTASAAFPGQFAAANELVHRWMFTENAAQSQDGDNRWLIDLGPMLADSTIKSTLEGFGVQVPESLVVPVSVALPEGVQPGQLRQLTKWGPWVSVGACVLVGVFALLMIAVAKRRSKAIAALGVSALLVGAAGWAGIEVLRRRIAPALDATSGDMRQIADVMVDHAVGSMHLWLNLALAAGGALVAFGVIAAVLGGARRTRTVTEPVR